MGSNSDEVIKPITTTELRAQYAGGHMSMPPEGCIAPTAQLLTYLAQSDAHLRAPEHCRFAKRPVLEWSQGFHLKGREDQPKAHGACRINIMIGPSGNVELWAVSCPVDDEGDGQDVKTINYADQNFENTPENATVIAGILREMIHSGDPVNALASTDFSAITAPKAPGYEGPAPA